MNPAEINARSDGEFNPPRYKIRMKGYTICCENAEMPSRLPITTAREAAPYLTRVLSEADPAFESFAVLFLNGRHRPIACRILFTGGQNITPVFPGVIARHALLLGSAAVVLGHNHPSGELDPSPADKSLTQRVEKGLGLLDIKVLDHIITSGDRWRATKT